MFNRLIFKRSFTVSLATVIIAICTLYDEVSDVRVPHEAFPAKLQSVAFWTVPFRTQARSRGEAVD